MCHQDAQCYFIMTYTMVLGIVSVCTTTVTAFCQHKSNLSSGKVNNNITAYYFVQHTIEPSPLDKLPLNFLYDVEAAGDRLVAKVLYKIK